MATIIGANIYIDGVKHNTIPVPLDGALYDISDIKGPGESFNIRASLVFDNGTESALSTLQELALLADTFAEDYEMISVAMQGTNASQPLVIPDGNSPIHPRVLDMGTQWNGYRYWMAFTPYASEAAENPSISASNDIPSETQLWERPIGLTNPVYPQPATGYNSDSELVYDEANDLLWLVNRQVNDVGASQIQVKSSPDGVNWSATAVIFNSGLLSPTIQKDGDVFRVWMLDGNDKIWTATCATMDGIWSALEECKVYSPAIDRWHLSVNKIDNRYHAFIYSRDGNLYFSESEDAKSFFINANPILSPSASGWDSTNLYQSCGIILENGNYGLYYTGYGAHTDGTDRNIGFTEIPIPFVDTRTTPMITDGLIGFFNMDETAGNPLDTHGSLTASATPSARNVEGKINSCFRFEGGNLKITGENMKSFSFWLNIESFPADWAYLFDARPAVTAYHARNTTATTTSGIAKLKIFNYTATPYNLWEKGKFIHVYIEITTPATGTITFMSHNGGGDKTFGLIDLMGVYNKALSDAEINQNINYRKGITL